MNLHRKRESRGILRRPRRWSGILLLACMSLLASCGQRSGYESVSFKDRVSETDLKEMLEQKQGSVLKFGFDLRSGPKEDARQYLPFLTYLGKSTGYRFELYFVSKDGNIADPLGQGLVQFAAIGSVGYMIAHEKYGVILLVSGLNSAGRAEYRSMIIVSPRSPIMDIRDLRGKQLAFGSSTSTQGYVIPLISLAEHGMTIDDLSGHMFTGSHQNCANAVISGRADACGIQDTMAQKLARAGAVRIIFTSPYYPSSCIAANRSVPPVIIAKVKRALLDFQPAGRDAAGLYHWDKTEMPLGFAEAHDGNYQYLRDWIRRLNIQFGGSGKQP